MKSRLQFLIAFLFSLASLTIHAREIYEDQSGIRNLASEAYDNNNFNLQGEYYHFWQLSNMAYAGPSVGVMFFIEDDTIGSFKPLPAFYIPIAAKGDVKLSYRLRLKLSLKW